MQKHPDIHFGKDEIEIVCKLCCWTFTFLVIWGNYARDTSDVFSKSLAVSVMAFSLSCLSSIFLAIREKKSKFAKVVHSLFALGFLVTTFTSLSITAFDFNFFTKDHCYYHLYFFGFVIFLVLVDFFVVLTDIDAVPEETDDYRRAYFRLLNGKRK